MTSKELERLERIAVQILAAYCANPGFNVYSEKTCAGNAIDQAQELIKQLDALKIAE